MAPQPNLNYSASFGETVEPFEIAVHDEFLELTKAKLSLTRFVDDELSEPEFSDGPPTRVARAITSYWLHQYNWHEVEGRINSNLSQYTVVVQPSTSPAQFSHPVPLHFVHHRSHRPDAIPLLFVHGWPGSFLEILPIISELTSPSDDSQPAFHVVSPSIPGYGFSPSPRFPGFGYRAAASAFHALMTAKLGYDKFVFQGGDAGDLINRYLAHDFPSNVVSGHSNFWVVPPPRDESSGTEEGKLAANALHAFFNNRWAYAQIQQTRPLRLAAAMTDSPIGLAMWIYDALVGSIEPERAQEVWTEERVITWTMMHWVNGPYGAFGLYKQGAKDGAINLSSINLLPYVSQPVAISQFPYDIGYRTPLSWAQQAGNVVSRSVHDKGGHFPALTDTQALLEDVRKFFADRKLSKTIVFDS